MDLMFDSNVFDELVSGNLSLDLFESKSIKVYVTHIQIDQINKCTNIEKRAKLFLFMIQAKPEKVATESFIFGHSRLGFAKLGGGGMIEILKAGNLKNTDDALIGETAIRNNLILITNDIDFRKKVMKLGGTVMNTQELKNLVNSIK